MKPKKKKKKKKKKKRWKKNKYEYEQWKINNRSESQIYTDSFLEYEYYDEYLEPEDYESEDFTADYSDYPYLPKPRGGKAKRAPMLKRLRNPRLRKKRPKRYRGLRCLRCGKIIEDGIYCVSCSMVMDLLEGKCPLCKEPMENRECKNENCISHEIRE